MKTPALRLLRSPLALLCLLAAGHPLPALAQDGKAPASVVDLATWTHPVKAVFAKYKVSLKRVQIDAAKSFVFDVAFPYDPESSQTSHYFNRLYIETIAALGWKNFAFRDAPDQLRIEITGNRAKKSVSVEFVTLQ